MAEGSKNALLELANVVKTYRDYMVEVVGQPAEMFGPDFDKNLDVAVTRGKKSVIKSGVRSVAETARAVEGTREGEELLKFFREKLGKELFEIISTPAEEAQRIIKRGKVIGFGEARILCAFVELYSDDGESKKRVAQAALLLDNYENETSPES